MKDRMLSRKSADPFRGRTLVVPAHVFESRREALAAAGIRGRKVEVKAGECVIDARLIGSESSFRSADKVRAAARLMGLRPDNVETEPGVLGSRLIQIVMPKGREAVIHDRSRTGGEERGKEDSALNVYAEMLRRFSRLTGKRVHLYCDSGDIRAPEPESPGAVHIFTNASPPGDSQARSEGVVFGLSIRSDCMAVTCSGPAVGRGSVVKDGRGAPVAQVLGSNFYFLVPAVGVFHGAVSKMIFEKLLAASWSAYRTLRMEPPRRRKTGRPAFVEATSAWTRAGEDHFAGAMKKNDVEIQNTLSRLAQLYRVKREYENLLAVFKTARQADDPARRLGEEFDAIRGEPGVAGLEIVENGLHVATGPVTLEHGGRRYPVGAFVIRISRFGSVAVWNESPTHPQGVPHPHIAKDGGPCFGNASDAIARAAGESRYADAVHLIMRWLRQGYTPELAAVKIEEWPTEGETLMQAVRRVAEAEAVHTDGIKSVLAGAEV